MAQLCAGNNDAVIEPRGDSVNATAHAASHNLDVRSRRAAHSALQRPTALRNVLQRPVAPYSTPRVPYNALQRRPTLLTTPNTIIPQHL